jgi:hypothetical protein
MMLLLGSLSLSAQHVTADSVLLTGTWKLKRVEGRIFSDADVLLNTTIINEVEGKIALNAFVPVFLLFDRSHYTMVGQLDKEKGLYELFKGKMRCIPLTGNVVDHTTPLPAKFCRYSIQDDGILSLQMPDVYYYDNKLSKSVRETAICYYQKMNDKGE